jgi:large subunit ribosomal protein L20
LARTARSTHARKKRRKVLEQAKGYRGQKSRSYKKAKEQVWKSGVYAYEGRKQRKRDFRALWIQRINAATREQGLSYSRFVHGLRLAEIDLDRKILADLATTEPEAFAAIVAQATNALNGDPVQSRIEIERPNRPGPERAAPEPAQPEAELEPVEGSDAEGRVEEEAGEVQATGAAERKAEELGVDLTTVTGTGQSGRITVGDVEKAARADAER